MKQKTVRRLEIDKPIDYEREEPVIASVEISRITIFSPSLKRTSEDVWQAETPWGSVTVKGRLTQVHRSVLDAIFAFPIDATRYTDKSGEPGPAVFLINPYEIAKKAGVSAENREWLEKTILEDMRVASVDLKNKNGETICYGGIISDWSKAMSFPHRGAIKEMSLLRVTVSTAWMRLADETMGVSYRNLLDKIGEIKSGHVQSIIRTFLTQRGSIKYSLDKAIAISIGGEEKATKMSRQALDKIKKNILSYQAILERDFGIELKQEEGEEGKMKWYVLYSQHEEVRFAPPIKKS